MLFTFGKFIYFFSNAMFCNSNNYFYQTEKLYEYKKTRRSHLMSGYVLFLSDPGGIRTHDPQLRRLLLYPAELLDQLSMSETCSIVISWRKGNDFL